MTAKPMTCFPCESGKVRGDLFSRDNVLRVVCLEGHADTPKRADQCKDFRYCPGSDEAERPA